MPKTMTRPLFDQIVALLDEDDSGHLAISRRVGVNASTVRKIALGQHRYQTGATKSRNKAYMPTPEEIEAKCDKMRRDRSPSEWMPPEYPAIAVS